MLLLTLALACSTAPTPGSGGAGATTAGAPTTPAVTTPATTPTTPSGSGFVPGPATLHRLTDAQWRNAVADLTGVAWDGPLPEDLPVGGFTRIGAASLGVASLDLEEYESAAWGVATLAAPDDAGVTAFLGCAPDAACVRAWATGFARRAWRRPVGGDEVDELVHLYDEVHLLLGSDVVAVQAAVASVLLAPDFVFRVELGEPDPTDATRLLYTSHEMATRLSFLLWDTAPDDELLAAADAGLLTDTHELRAQAGRLLEDPRAAPAMERFFAEWMNLSRLELVDKDAALFPEWTPELRAAMRAEAEHLFADVALVDRSLADLFTTSEGYANADLGPIYGIEGLGAELSPVVVPPEQDRGGILGRAAFLALNAHATATSPTHRGKYVRTRLMCIDIPPPPEGVIASLDALGDVDGTLRDKLELHMTEPVCEGCHVLMDPIGFGFEHFDPIGTRRELDNGYPIDASVDLDGATGYGAADLGRLVAESPLFSWCIATQVFRHAAGRLEDVGDLDPILELEDAFVDADLRFTDLVLATITHDAFRTATGPFLAECTEEAAERACSTACGDGVQTCLNGRWTVCDAPAPAVEACNAVDDDCDGGVDEDVVRACDAPFGPGLETCTDGAWSDCVGPPPPPEVCNGLDDDLDGLVDEDLEVDLVRVSFDDLIGAHASCDAVSNPTSGPCRAAANRICGARACSVTGWGLIDRDVVGRTATLACLSDAEATIHHTTFTELQSHHPWCDPSNPVTPDCNASINRWCAARGEASGFGPLEHSGDAATIACMPRAGVFLTPFPELATYAASCDGSTERMGPACDTAHHGWCRDAGYATGYGPLENYADDSWTACVGVFR